MLQKIWKSEKQREKIRSVPAASPSSPSLPLGVSLLLAFSDAGLYFCLFVIIVSGQFWVLLPPICFVASGSRQFLFFNVCGMGWGWG